MNKKSHQEYLEHAGDFAVDIRYMYAAAASVIHCLQWGNGCSEAAVRSI